MDWLWSRRWRCRCDDIQSAEPSLHVSNEESLIPGLNDQPYVWQCPIGVTPGRLGVANPCAIQQAVSAGWCQHSLMCQMVLRQRHWKTSRYGNRQTDKVEGRDVAGRKKIWRLQNRYVLPVSKMNCAQCWEHSHATWRGRAMMYVEGLRAALPPRAP